MKKCNFCNEPATRKTTFYRLGKSKLFKKTAYMIHAVCEKHYFIMEHGLETIVCPSCKRLMYIPLKHYYDDMDKIFCVYCGDRIEES